jgi:hypothetical protein
MPKPPTCSINPILQQTDNSAHGYTEMAITVAVGVENVCLSRRSKAEQVVFRSGIQTSASFIHSVAQKSDQAPVYQSVQNLISTES